MKCPVCKEVNLLMSERQGIEIDYCPECRGVWLDRGELDKIIEKNDKQINYESQEVKRNEHLGDKRDSSDYYKKEDGKNNSYNNQKPRKKESFITNVFDMFGGD